VHQDHRLAASLLPHEAANSTGLELSAGSPVLLYGLRDGASHGWIIALCGFAFIAVWRRCYIGRASPFNPVPRGQEGAA